MPSLFHGLFLIFTDPQEHSCTLNTLFLYIYYLLYYIFKAFVVCYWARCWPELIVHNTVSSWYSLQYSLRWMSHCWLVSYLPWGLHTSLEGIPLCYVTDRMTFARVAWGLQSAVTNLSFHKCHNSHCFLWMDPSFTLFAFGSCVFTVLNHRLTRSVHKCHVNWKIAGLFVSFGNFHFIRVGILAEDFGERWCQYKSVFSMVSKANLHSVCWVVKLHNNGRVHLV